MSLFAIGLHYFLPSASETIAAYATPITKIRPNISSNLHPPATPSELERSNELDHTLAEGAKLITKEVHEHMIDVLMKFREPRYRTLFKEWNLDSATADLTLKIIRDKESHTKAALREFRKDGISGVKKAAEAFDEEAQMSPIQLTGLLGEDHFKELSRREAEMDGDETTISVNFDVPRINRADLPIAHRKYKSQ